MKMCTFKRFLTFFSIGLAFSCIHLSNAEARVSAEVPNLTRMYFAERIIQPVQPLANQMKGSLIRAVLPTKEFLGEVPAKMIAEFTGETVASVTASVPSKLGQSLPSAGNTLQRNLRDNIRLGRRVAKKSAEDLKEERRAQMVLWHQILGYATLAFMAATVVIGQINAVDFFDKRLSSQSMLWAHRILSIGTSATYIGAGVLGWTFALTKEKDDDDDDDKDDDDDDDDKDDDKEFDSSKWHRILAWIHGFGMLGLAVGGALNAHVIPSDTIGKSVFTVSHLAIGYITLAALAAAMILISFF